MAIQSLSVLVDGAEGKEFLSEKYVGLLENVQARTISSLFKNTELSGDPEAGTLKAKRFTNSKSKNYGTARAAGAGEKLKDMNVAVDIDIDKEIIEEIEEKDIKLLGVEGLVNKRSTNHGQSMERELDTAFFMCAAKDGTKFETDKPTVKQRLDAIVLKLHKTKNEYVDGVEKELIHVVLDPEAYEEMRDYIDTKPNAHVKTDVEEFGKYHGVWVYSNIHQPDGVEMIAMCKESIAQPVMPSPYKPSRIPLSRAIAIELFYSYGTKSVMPDLIYYSNKPGVTEVKAMLLEDETNQTQAANVSAPQEDALEKMTIDQMKAYAEDNGYSVTKTKKDEIMEELRAQIAAQV